MRYALVIFFTVLSLNAIAQYQYTPMPFDDGTWSYKDFDLISAQHGTNNEYSYHFITNGEDTMANGKKYYKVFFRYSITTYKNIKSGIVDVARKPDVCTGGIREDTSKRIVYYKNFASNNFPNPGKDTIERIIYDFNQKVGDTLHNTHIIIYEQTSVWQPVNVIYRIDTIVLNGKTRRRLYTENVDTTVPYIFKRNVIEGIGSTDGLLLYSIVLPVVGKFTCHSSGNFIYYPNTNYKCFYIHPYGTPVGINELTTQTINIYPNPTTNVVTIEAPVGTHVIVYNSTGKIVTTRTSKTMRETIDLQKLPSGLYIINLHNELLRIDQRKKLMKL